MTTWTYEVAQQTDTATGYGGNNVGDGWYFHDGLYRVTVDRASDRLGALYECFKIENGVSTQVGSATVATSASTTDWNMHTSMRTSNESLVTTITKWGGKIGYIGVQVAADGTLTTRAYTELGVVAGVLANRFPTAQVSQANDGAVIITAVASTFVDTSWFHLADAGIDLTLTQRVQVADRPPKPLFPMPGGYVLCTETIPYQSAQNFFSVWTRAGVRVAQVQFDGAETGVNQSHGDTQLMPDGRVVAAITRYENNYAIVKLTYALIGVSPSNGAITLEQITWMEGMADADCYNLKPFSDRLLALWYEGPLSTEHMSIIEPTTGLVEFEVPLPEGIAVDAPTNIEVMNDSQYWMEAYDYPVITDWLYTVTAVPEEIIPGPRDTRTRFSP